MFEVWGYTPPPEPPPEPAISNWAPTDIASQLTPTGYTIVVTTNIPVHLWMRWSLNEPLKRPSEEFRRGILLMSGVRWCFVNWKENEQEEPGDTLVHTFIKPDWPVCQTRWFYFLGTKQAEESPSASPIFHLHREAVPITTYPSLWHNRYVYSRHGTWSTARNGYGESKDGVYQRPDNKLSVHTGLIATYFIIRAYLNFHTQGVGVVKSARLGLYVTDIPAYNFDLCITKGLWDEPVIPEDFGLQTDETTILGQKSTADMVIGQYNWIDLNQAGIDWINQRPVEINQFESYDWNANMSIWVCAVQQVLMSFTPTGSPAGLAA